MKIFWTSLVVLSIITSSEAFCACCVQTCEPPPCPPPIVCSVPAPCPAPPPCPPPPPPCPPPPPPPCPPPPPPPCYPPMCGPPPPPMMLENTCCVMCSDPCAYMARKRRDVTDAEFGVALTQVTDDPVCNDLELKAIMQDTMGNDTSTSRRKIKTVAETKLHVKISVMCARGEFSYSAYTHSFCQVRKDDLTCYAFRSSI